MDLDAISEMCNITASGSTSASDQIPGEDENYQRITRARKVPVFSTLPIKRSEANHKKSSSHIPLLNETDH